VRDGSIKRRAALERVCAGLYPAWMPCSIDIICSSYVSGRSWLHCISFNMNIAKTITWNRPHYRHRLSITWKHNCSVEILCSSCFSNIDHWYQLGFHGIWRCLRSRLIYTFISIAITITIITNWIICIFMFVTWASSCCNSSFVVFSQCYSLSSLMIQVLRLMMSFLQS
jgi:hypothetical protein